MIILAHLKQKEWKNFSKEDEISRPNSGRELGFTISPRSQSRPAKVASANGSVRRGLEAYMFSTLKAWRKCRLSIKNSTPEDHRAMTWATWSSTSKIDSSREEGKLLLKNHLNARKRNSDTHRKAQKDSPLGQDFASSDCNLKEGAYREAKVRWRAAPKSSRGNKSPREDARWRQIAREQRDHFEDFPPRN